jgi:ribonuclease HI
MNKIYTDGSCLKNPGKGGWAFIFINKNNDEIHMSDYEENTTNNRMEMKAVIEALKFLEKNNEKCIIYTDSLLVINCATNKWKRKSNLDLWKEYDNECCNKNIEFNWVKGHSGNEYNEKVDRMAFNEAKNIK